jgi:hypothetical protein
MRTILNNQAAIVMDTARPVNIFMIKITKMRGERQVRTSGEEKTGAMRVIALAWFPVNPRK